MNKRTDTSIVTFLHWAAFGVVATAEMARAFSFIAYERQALEFNVWR